jgi:hypothetical protein
MTFTEKYFYSEKPSNNQSWLMKNPGGEKRATLPQLTGFSGAAL